MADTPNVIGVSSLAAKFKTLSTDMETRVARAMVVSGGRLIRDRAKQVLRQNGSVLTGALLANIVIKRQSGTPTGVSEYHIGVRHGKHLTKKQKAGATLGVRDGRVVKQNANDPWYWFLVEYTGARPHHIGRGSYLARKGRLRSKKQGRLHPGFKPKPFLVPALDGEKGAAIQAMETRLDIEIKKVNR